MLYRHFGNHGADAARAEAVVSVIAERGASDVARQLENLRTSVAEPTEFREATVGIGTLLGFLAIADESTVRWQLAVRSDSEERHEADGPDTTPTTRVQLVISASNTQAVSELVSAAASLSALLSELGWRASLLPRRFLGVAIERGFSRHGLSTTELLRRLAGTHP